MLAPKSRVQATGGGANGSRAGNSLRMCGGNAPSEPCASNEELIRLICRPTRDPPHFSTLGPAQKVSGSRVGIQARMGGFGQRAGQAERTFPPLALSSKSTVESHRIAIDSWQHMRDHMCTFSALMLTSRCLRWLARHAEDRRGGSVVVPIMKACESSIGICPECAHAPAHL